MYNFFKKTLNFILGFLPLNILSFIREIVVVDNFSTRPGIDEYYYYFGIFIIITNLVSSSHIVTSNYEESTSSTTFTSIFTFTLISNFVLLFFLFLDYKLAYFIGMVFISLFSLYCFKGYLISKSRLLSSNLIFYIQPILLISIISIFDCEISHVINLLLLSIQVMLAISFIYTCFKFNKLLIGFFSISTILNIFYDNFKILCSSIFFISILLVERIYVSWLYESDISSMYLTNKFVLFPSIIVGLSLGTVYLSIGKKLDFKIASIFITTLSLFVVIIQFLFKDEFIYLISILINNEHSNLIINITNLYDHYLLLVIPTILYYYLHRYCYVNGLVLFLIKLNILFFGIMILSPLLNIYFLETEMSVFIINTYSFLFIIVCVIVILKVNYHVRNTCSL